DVAHGVVAGVADGAAAEARQAGDVRRAVRGEVLLQEPQRVGVFRLDDRRGSAAGGLAGDVDVIAVGLEAQERAGAEERVAAEALAADDALEQERPVALLDLAERADRRQRVADQLAVDRHDAGAARQLDEFFVSGTVTHHNKYEVPRTKDEKRRV